MEKIEIHLPRLTEEVYIGSEILSEATTLIKDLDYDGFLVVIDKGAYKANMERFDRLFLQLSITAERVIKLRPTYESKDFHTVEKILRRLTAFDATRRVCILAIGGGYVGDVVGFAAAIYMRGIHFVQIPTTFMAQADAIIGKVAINFEGKKNQLGAFHSPRLTFCDISFIDGFAFNELVYGLVEVWKHALLVNDTATVKSIESLLAANGQNTDYKSLIRFSLETKGRFVEQDPEDVHGSHKALSLGHTLANVLETSLRLRHGAAVYYGLLFETILARNLGKIGAERFSAIMNTGVLFEKRLQKLAHIKRFIKRKNLVRALRGDKINSHGRYSFVIPGEAGYEIVKDLGADVINRTAKEFSVFKFDS
jgi:3-dehydroquinate synthase